MIKYSRIFLTLLLASFAFGVSAQSTATTSSPYSRYGLGTIDPPLLPQNIAMGGISTAINKITFFSNINPANPASYATMNYTVIDAGIYSNIENFSQTGQPSATNANFRISHIAFGIPITKRSAVSFGLLPYSEMGYNYKESRTGFGSGSAADTNVVNNIYSGSGGLSKAYFGYGFGIGKHLMIGGNASFIFGNLQQYSSTEIPSLYGFFNSKTEQSNSIRGVDYDYGAQYSFDFGTDKTKHLVLGYSASTGSSLNSTSSYIVSQYTFDANGNANVAVDSVVNHQGTKTSVKLPQIHHFGISYQNDGHFLVGADYSMGNWSSLTVDGVNQGLQNSKTFNIGGQWTPDIYSLHNYFARTDYRLGFIYDQSYLNLNNTSIKTLAVTFGLGLPLPPNNANNTFYKINFSAEFGRQGTLQNGLVKQNFVSLHLNFTFNDKWFQRIKYN